MFKDFKKFIMRGNVVDMAVGIIIGNAFKEIVTSLVDNIIMPAISCLIGKVDISGLSATFGEIHIAYGQFLNTILNFLIIAFSLFMAIKVVNKINDLNKAALSKLGRKTGEENPAPTTKKCPYCFSEIDIKATRCAHCTSIIEDNEEKTEETSEEKVNVAE
ncbi:MAG: large conductance mechanosensitive channel protein MscL [Clostridia bacterium]|nr:large conductance mechanosensitive channel protein MscL [Clostridia bacterium]